MVMRLMSLMMSNHSGTTPTALICLLICVSSALMAVALCAKNQREISSSSPSSSRSECSPRKLMKSLRNKAIFPKTVMCMKLSKRQDLDDEETNINGEGCLWKKAILMGDKCQPLQFSGAVYYDSEGNQLSEPRTPSITSPFAVRKDGN